MIIFIYKKITKILKRIFYNAWFVDTSKKSGSCLKQDLAILLLETLKLLKDSTLLCKQYYGKMSKNS
jgi:hypothetical protein